MNLNMNLNMNLKRKLLPLIAALLLAAFPAAAETGQTGYTKAVPAAYQARSSRPGTVEEIRYESRDYARNAETVIQKRAYVYLPYGYGAGDADTRYSIVYLMHGMGGHAGDFFNFPSTKKILDNLIEKGDIEPAIFVSPTFYNKNSDRGLDGSVEELRTFYLEFENDLIPAVEGRYRTFAASAADEDLKASRDHRAFGGFSLGGVATWLEFCHDTDYIRYFLPMSGASLYYGSFSDFQTGRNVDHLEEVIRDKDLNGRDWFIFHAVGTLDHLQSQSVMMAEEMLAREGAFPPEHYVFYRMEGGRHDFDAVQEYLYNALPLFFRDGTETGGQG